MSMLGLKNASASPPYPSISKASQQQQYNARPVVDQPILPSSSHWHILVGGFASFVLGVVLGMIYVTYPIQKG